MNQPLRSEESMVFSYLALRITVGILGFAFPFILSLGALILYQTDMQGSMSAYYHTGMRDVFVGTLCVIGFFLLSYRGYERSDDIAGSLACLFAVGVAIFPTNPDGVGGSRVIGFVHQGFAVVFFLILIYFSLFLFTKTNPEKQPTRRKLVRNKVYRVCGYTMIVCILLIVIYSLLPSRTNEDTSQNTQSCILVGGFSRFCIWCFVVHKGRGNIKG
jgi:hypothetical protein